MSADDQPPLRVYARRMTAAECQHESEKVLDRLENLTDPFEIRWARREAKLWARLARERGGDDGSA